MALADLQEKYDGFYTPRFSVTIAGETYQESHGVVTDVVVDATLDGADRFSLSINGRFDREQGRFRDVDWGRIAVDEPVEIELGYGDRLERMLVGSITEIQPSFPADGAPTVDVSGYGRQHELTKGTNSESWDDATDSSVAGDVAGRYGFSEVVVDRTDIERPKVVQDDESDYAFLTRLAERNDAGNGPYEAFASRDTFHFRASADDRDPRLSLAYGESLTSFTSRFNTARQVAEVEVRHWDPGRKTSIVGTATREDGAGEGKQVVRRPVRSRTEAETVASAKLKQDARGRLTGRGETVGLPDIRVGEPIELTGLGERFSRTYYVERTTHRTGPEGYTTSFDVRLPDGVMLS